MVAGLWLHLSSFTIRARVGRVTPSRVVGLIVLQFVLVVGVGVALTKNTWIE